MLFLDFPSEILSLILKSISAKDILAVMLVNKLCLRLARDLIEPVKILYEYRRAFAADKPTVESEPFTIFKSFHFVLVPHKDELCIVRGNYTTKADTEKCLKSDKLDSLTIKSLVLSALMGNSEDPYFPGIQDNFAEYLYRSFSSVPLLHILHTHGSGSLHPFYNKPEIFQALKCLNISASTECFEREDFFVLRGAVGCRLLETIAFLLEGEFCERASESFCATLMKLSFSPKLKFFDLSHATRTPRYTTAFKSLRLPYEWRESLEACRSEERSPLERAKICFSDEQGPRGNLEEPSSHFQSLSNWFSAILGTSTSYRVFFVSICVKKQIYCHGESCICESGFELVKTTHHHIDSERDEMYQSDHYFQAIKWFRSQSNIFHTVISL
ncbi:hypothetical protein TWF706_000746 [Orbilia oligospora]|nr:hypothetical protein TWF706_000746 [Orbilia oligospora]